MKNPAREERLRREAMREKLFTLLLRLFCASISLVILGGAIFLLSGDEMKEITKSRDFQRSGPQLILALFSLFAMTTSYAIFGDKVVRFFHKFFNE